MQIQAPKGMKDITPKESYKWQYIEKLMRERCAEFGYRETRTPVLEHTELFARGVGDTTDIVQKEMYTFTDKGERSVTLKPEGTAGAVRMFLENKLFADAQPTKMFYLYCPVFRYEKPQAGRLREHHQFGIEVFGAPRASADAEVISLAMSILLSLGIKSVKARINSIGCPECRPKYNEALKAYLKENYDALCDTCKTRYEKNPLRILDCKEKRCGEIAANAPKVLEYLCPECKAHFEELKGCLDALAIEYEVDPMIVRGLDYYTKTVFELVSTEGEYTGTVCGGGRYDGLIEELGGPKMNAVGFGMGMERLLLVAESFAPIPEPDLVDVYIAPMGDEARNIGLSMAKQLRELGVKTDFDHVGRSFKAQFKYADKLKARFVAVIGEDEVKSGRLKLKNMADGTETVLPLEGFAQKAKELIAER